MNNPSIVKVLIGKPEKEAGIILERFNKSWRVVFRDGVQVPNLTQDRDDNRYGLVLKNNLVERVLFG